MQMHRSALQLPLRFILLRAFACLEACHICQGKYRNLKCVAEVYKICSLLSALSRLSTVPRVSASLRHPRHITSLRFATAPTVVSVQANESRLPYPLRKQLLYFYEVVVICDHWKGELPDLPAAFFKILCMHGSRSSEHSS